MTYQPYPTSGGSNTNVVEKGPRPSSLRTAVILMYVGAGLSVVSLIASLALSSRIKTAVGNALRKAKLKTPLTATQIHTYESVYFVVVVVLLVIAVVLWLWMAWANGRGKSWARIVASVFFGLSTLQLLLGSVRTGRSGTTLIFAALEWLVGLAALILLWRRDTTQYMSQPQSLPQ